MEQLSWARHVTIISNLGFLISSTSKSKESTSAVTPPPVRNGQAGPAPGQAAPSTSQLSVTQPQNAAGPSPHALRRGVCLFAFQATTFQVLMYC